MTSAIDALLVAQTVCIAAESKGMGICYLGTTTYMAKKIIEILKLPRGVVPVTTVTLGWPAENPDQVDSDSDDIGDVCDTDPAPKKLPKQFSNSGIKIYP